MYISKNKLKQTFIAIIICVLAIANASPKLLSLGIERQVYFIFLLFCFIFSFFKLLKGTMFKKIYLLNIIVVLLMFIFPFISAEITYANRYLFLSGLLLYPMLYEATKETRIPFIIIKILLIWSIYVCFHTIVVCNQFSYASRMADVSLLYQSMGVGGYMFIYAISLASVILFSYIINNDIKDNKTKLFLIIWFIYILTVYKSNFMTAVLVSIIGAALSILFKRTTLKNKVVLILVFVIFFIFLMGPCLELLETVITNILPESGRIRQIFSGSEGVFQAIFNEFISDRMPTIQTSINAIKENSLSGIIFSSKEINFGEHSTLFDTFALWGIPIGIFYFILIFKPFFNNLRICKYEYSIPILVSFFVLMIFNNIECTSAFIISYITLFYLDYCSCKKGESIHEKRKI